MLRSTYRALSKLVVVGSLLPRRRYKAATRNVELITNGRFRSWSNFKKPHKTWVERRMQHLRRANCACIVTRHYDKPGAKSHISQREMTFVLSYCNCAATSEQTKKERIKPTNQENHDLPIERCAHLVV